MDRFNLRVIREIEFNVRVGEMIGLLPVEMEERVTAMPNQLIMVRSLAKNTLGSLFWPLVSVCMEPAQSQPIA